MASFGLTDRLRSYAPDGDGYADQYATDMIHAATDLELMYKQVRELRRERDELVEFVNEVRRSGDTRLASMAIGTLAKVGADNGRTI